MIEKFEELARLGAGEFNHLDGSLIEHLQNTQKILNEWEASSVLQHAGLFHAAYGTAGFDESLTSINQRTSIATIIGKEAEEIVYQYSACDRDFFFPQFGKADKPIFRNRFTQEQYSLSNRMLKSFCELTAANEVEIASDNQEFKTKHGSALNNLFQNMAPHLSNFASLRTLKEFGE